MNVGGGQDRARLEREIRALGAEVFGSDLSSVDPEADLAAATGVDSLTTLRFLAAVERRYEVRFPDDRLGEIRSLAQVLEYVEGEQGREPPDE